MDWNKIKDNETCLVEYDCMARELIVGSGVHGEEGTVILKIGKHQTEVLGKYAKRCALFVEPKIDEFDDYCKRYLNRIEDASKNLDDKEKNEIAFELTQVKKLSPQARFFMDNGRDVKPLRSLTLVENKGVVKSEVEKANLHRDDVNAALLEFLKSQTANKK